MDQQSLQGTGSGLVTHAGLQEITDAQTSWVTMMGWARVGVTIIGILLGMAGYKIVSTPPTPAPDAVQQLIDVLKAQQAAKPAVVVAPITPTPASPTTQLEWNAENVRKWLEVESNKLNKETKK